MRGWVVAYRLPTGSPDVDRVKFRQRLIGATTTSWGGKYQHHREGLLERIPHWRVMPGLLLLTDEGVEELDVLLREWDARLLLKQVELARDDVAHVKPRPRAP